MDRKLIEARQEIYREAHNSLDVERFVALFSDDAEYSDNGLGVTGLNKEALKGLATSVFGSCKELEFTTVSVSGDKEFTAWEWTAAGIVSREIPGFPMKVGDEFKTMGCSLFWWTGQGEDAREYKIKREVEYTKMVV